MGQGSIMTISFDEFLWFLLKQAFWTRKSAYLVDVYHPENIKKIFDQSYENKITVKNIEWIGDDIIAAGSDSSSVYIAHARNNNQYILHGHRNVSTNSTQRMTIYSVIPWKSKMG